MRKVIFCGELFTAEDETVRKNMAVVVEGNKIVQCVDRSEYNEKKISEEDVEIIDLSDKFVMPGLIDAHVHLVLDGDPNVDKAYYKLHGELAIQAEVAAREDLMAGFTTVRDEGDIHYEAIAVKKCVGSGIISGPRIIASGAPLTGVGGHGDSFFGPDVQNVSVGAVINGADEAMKAARTNFKYGADQIKLFATGGVMSFGDDPGSSELTYEEMKAALDVANSKGRISSAHAHGAEGIKNAIRAGITTIEHGMLIDDEGMEMMAEKGVYLVPTIIAAEKIVEYGKEGKLPKWMADKAEQVLENHGEHIRKMLKMGVKIGFGTDSGTAFGYHGQQGYEFQLMTEFGFTPAGALLAATKVNSEMLRAEDKLGTIRPGKLADIVAFDGNPLEDIKVMTNCTFVMKDGKIYKN